jgi:hypothetical protein
MSKVGLILRVIENIRKLETQSDKREILNKYHNEVQLSRILNILYNPWIDLKLQEFQPKYMGKQFGMGMPQFMHVIDDIISGSFDQREAEFACRMAMNHINTDDAEIFLGILRQDLGLGLEIETINSVWPGLIADYPIRLATVGNADNFDRFPAAVQPLSQGLRVNIIVHDGTVSFRNKSGEVIENWGQYTEQFLNLAQGQNTVLDGHAVVASGTEIVSTDNDVVLSADPDIVRFILWDAVRYDGFIQGKDTRIGYNWRYNGVEHMMLLAREKNTNPCYDLLRAEMVGSHQQLMQTIKKHSACVIKPMNSIWQQGKTSEESIIINNDV